MRAVPLHTSNCYRTYATSSQQTIGASLMCQSAWAYQPSSTILAAQKHASVQIAECGRKYFGKTQQSKAACTRSRRRLVLDWYPAISGGYSVFASEMVPVAS